MTVEMEDVLAWIDNELEEPRAGQVKKAVMSDKNLQQIADKIRASQLPYSDAYEQAPLADVPESLSLKIQALQTPETQNSEGQAPEAQTPEIPNRPTDAANNSSFKMIGIAASVMLAAVIGYLAGANTSTRTPPDTSASVDTPQHSDNFAQTVAAYQQFYVRETLKGTVAPDTAKVAERLASQTGMQVIVPEFEGYEFLRAQRLSVDGKLLLQLLYLGAEGGPLALCYTALHDSEAGGQSNGAGITTLQKHHGLNTAEWRQNGHRFVLVSDAPEMKLDELSQSTQQQWSS